MRTWWSWALAIVGVDLAYYWYHRFIHRVRVGWAAHQAHHSSEYMNFAHRAAAEVESLVRLLLLAAAATAWRRAVGDLLRLRVQPRLPVFRPHRDDQEAAPAGRIRLQHAVPPPGASRVGLVLPGPQLRRHPDRVGPGLPARSSPNCIARPMDSPARRARTT